jgi:hypothetical protein
VFIEKVTFWLVTVLRSYSVFFELITDLIKNYTRRKMAAAGVYYENGRPTATGYLTMRATTSRTFKKFGEKQSVVVTFVASPSDQCRSASGFGSPGQKELMLETLKNASAIHDHQELQSVNASHSLILEALEKGGEFLIHILYIATRQAG